MKLIESVDLTEFMKAVRRCRKDVIFITAEGDQLNLKSAMSSFLFMLLQNKRDILCKGVIDCEDPMDMQYLTVFLTA